MEHLWWDLGSCAGGAIFEVSLHGSTARVCLMDADSYRAYRNEDKVEYEYHGGFFDVSPVILEVPHDDYWFVVVDSYPETVTAKVTQIFD